MSVLDRSFDVVLKEFGLVRRVHCEVSKDEWMYILGKGREGEGGGGCKTHMAGHVLC